MDYLAAMDTMNRDAGHARPSETEAGRQRRIAWEADRIAEARASADAGALIDEAEIDAWIDSLGTDHELPPPRCTC